MENVIVVQGKATLAIADAIRVAVSEEEQVRIAREKQVDPRAYEIYLRAREHFLGCTDESMESAIALFQQAHQIDPMWVEPLLGAAQAYHYGSLWGLLSSDVTREKMKELATQALALDSELAEAMAILAVVNWRFEYDFDGAEAKLSRALRLAPNNPTVHFLYGKFLNQMGRRDEAYGELDLALELSQGDIVLLSLVGNELIGADPNRSVSILEDLAAKRPDASFVVDGLASSYNAIAKPDKAVQVMREYVSKAGQAVWDYPFASALSYAGERDEATQIFDRLEREGLFNHSLRARNSRNVFMGDYNAYFDVLAEMIETRHISTVYDLRERPYIYEKVQPFYKEIRQDPRYWDLVEDIGLPPLPSGHPGPGHVHQGETPHARRLEIPGRALPAGRQ